MSDECISEDKFWDDWGVIQKSDGGMFDFDDVKINRSNACGPS